MENIRLLRADEIECRVGSVKEGSGLSLLLYKDARCDMKILDEVFGSGNWARTHEIIGGNLFCNVGVRFERENGIVEWVWKQDVGTESYTEKEKGQASDSFKRACFNWGIGRELYTAPFIWVSGGNKNDKFFVKEIGYNDNREIVQLVIENKKGDIVYKTGAKVKTEAPKTPSPQSKKTGQGSDEIITDPQKKRLFAIAKAKGFTADAVTSKVLELYGVTVSEMKVSDYKVFTDKLDSLPNK